jgi:8-oxo-dGTP pyrophosphatase MutT (NUDIX family)
VNTGYQRLARREIYRNPWVSVDIHEIVHPTGAPGEHLSIGTGRASAVLVEDRGSFLFARQARFAAGIAAIEIVKGGADAGETALACAQRELREELGITAERWSSLGITYEIPSIVEHPVALFLAEAITVGDAQLEAVEEISAVPISIEDTYRACIDGRIDDAVTLAAILRYRLR